MKRILYIADPNLIHDIKWISYFTERKDVKAFLLYRREHAHGFNSKHLNFEFVDLSKIHDFSMVRFLQTLYTAIRIKRLIKSNAIDGIHIYYAEPNALWCVFRDYFNVPMIITCRGTDVLKTIPEAFSKKNLINKLVAPAYKYAFQKADWVTGTSQRQLDSVKQFSGRMDGMSIIRTGVDVKKLNSDTSIFIPLKKTKPFILFPRYIKPIYNHEFCLEAIEKFPDHIKENHQLVFLGKDSGDLEYQQKLMDIMAAMPNVDFEFLERQNQESIFELYKQASLVVMTPVSDGSPVSGMEVLLCGAKLILGPLDYDKDIFSENVTQLKEWDSDELSNLMVKALDEPKSKIALSTKVKKLMDREYNMKEMGKIYKQIVQ